MSEFLDSVSYNAWILPALLVLPMIGASVIWIRQAVRPGGDEGTDAGAMFARRVAFITFLIEFVVSLGLWWSFDAGSAGWQAGVDLPWIEQWGTRFSIGVDGISLMMVLLTTFLMPLAILGGWTSVKVKVSAYHALMLVMTSGMLGVFLARDLFLFYVFWEVMLVPMYFIIGIWGGERRIYASLKFFIFTLVGSLLMLVAILYLGVQAADPVTGQMNFAYDHILRSGNVSFGSTLWLFGAFSLAFAIKVPMFPVHTWLPDAHVEAPTAGSVVLASIMLKLGTYGFLRFSLPLFPAASMHPAVRTTMIVLSVIGVIYGSLVALVQPDFKKLVAYSSVAHLGMVMLGVFALTRESIQGALMVMIAHGLSTGALFLLIGVMYERRHTRLLADYGGIAKVVPMFATALTIVTLSSVGLPGTVGFVAEYLALMGSLKTYPLLTTVATIGVILSAAYMLWAIQRIIYNPLDKPVNAHMPDLNLREIGYMVPIIAAIIWLGVYPKPVLTRMEASATKLVEHVEVGAGIRPASTLTVGDR